jgi:hypothetical protein
MPSKFIKPDPIKLGDVTRAIDLGLQTSGEIVKAEYALFTGTWTTKNQPDWKEKKPGSSSVRIDATPIGGGTITFTDRVWAYTTASTPMLWVDDGTKAHDIPKSPMPGGKFLAFKTGFIAKTKPGQLSSGPGASFGPTAFAKQVRHPGNAPRNISIKIGENADDHLPRSVQQALDRVGSL